MDNTTHTTVLVYYCIHLYTMDLLPVEQCTGIGVPPEYLQECDVYRGTMVLLPLCLFATVHSPRIHACRLQLDLFQLHYVPTSQLQTERRVLAKMKPHACLRGHAATVSALGLCDRMRCAEAWLGQARKWLAPRSQGESMPIHSEGYTIPAHCEM